jgi:osmotically-inducible protein OsmY
MKIKFSLLAVGAVLASLAFTACETTTPSNNSRVTVNNNTGVVTNSSNTTMVNNNGNTTTVVSNSNTQNSNVTREEYDKKKADYEKDKGTSTIGQGVNDSWIWFKTKTALAAADDLRDSTINVDVANDVITLKGTVATAAQKAKAETVAKGIEGQKGVKNTLQVKANDSMTNQMVNGNTKSNANMNKK